jgi:hypothetical protein
VVVVAAAVATEAAVAVLQREREERKWVLADREGRRRGREAREGAALALMD